MPRPSMPPTPAPSTDIKGKSNKIPTQLDTTFALPPAAIGSTTRGSSRSSTTAEASDSSYHPPSPTSPFVPTTPMSRKRSKPTRDATIDKDCALPPPPTRARKIIQMNPGNQDTAAPTKPPASGTGSKASASGSGNATTAGNKRKQPNSNTAASKKVARKTQHSLIERRRRFKMNEVFGTLKDMVPACTGQDSMHKLAILQETIEYMRYLQKCVADLQAYRDTHIPLPPQVQTSKSDLDDSEEEDEKDEGDEEDENMVDASPSVPNNNEDPQLSSSRHFANASSAIFPPNISPDIPPSHSRRYSSSTSPAIQPSDLHRFSLTSSMRSTATANSSTHTSPAFGGMTPQPSQFFSLCSNPPSRKDSLTNLALPSPTLGPQADNADHEATRALMLLNSDRRSWGGSRGMSVKDLLSPSG